jgi:hypothetical protein
MRLFVSAPNAQTPADNFLVGSNFIQQSSYTHILTQQYYSVDLKDTFIVRRDGGGTDSGGDSVFEIRSTCMKKKNWLKPKPTN